MSEVVVAYFILINVIGFITMGLDKQWAKQRKRRVPEKNLWWLAVLGGAFLMTIAMKLFRHKTKHQNFKWGFPALAIIYLTLYWLLFKKMS